MVLFVTLTSFRPSVRFVVGTLDLMVTENYVIVYFCAGGQKDKLPGISWLKECYTTIDRR